jgi:uncharacterized membrane protein YkvI
MTRQRVAEFLLGFFALPVCALLGGLEALFFKLHGWGAFAMVAAFALFPIGGALKTKQKSLLAGLFAGLAVSVVFYLGVLRNA